MNKKSFSYFFITFALMFCGSGFSGEQRSILGTNSVWVDDDANFETISDIKVSNLQIHQVRDMNSKGCSDRSEVLDHIEINGPINPDTPFIVARLISKIKDNNRCSDGRGTRYAVDVYINSGGGYIKDGYELGRIFRREKVRTMIAYNGECFSSCAAAFLGGYFREMGKESKLMFHAPYRYKNSYYGIGRPDISCSTKDDELRNYMITMLDRESGNFLYDRTMSYCSVSDGWSLNKGAAEIFNILNEG